MRLAPLRRSLGASSSVASSLFSVDFAARFSFRGVAAVTTLCLAGLVPAVARPLPPAPAHLTAAPGNGQVALSWSSVAGATAYRILYASDAGGPYTPVARVAKPHFVISGLTNWLPHFYEVVAVSRWGQSVPSTQAIAVPEGIPAAPRLVRAKPGNTQVSLVWTPSPGAESYTVFRSVSAGKSETPAKAGIRTAVWTDSALTNGISYSYRVAAVLSPEHNAALSRRTGRKAVAASALSQPLTVMPSTALPLAPTGLAAVLGTAKVHLTWTDGRGSGAQDQGKTAISAASAPLAHDHLTYNLYRGTASGGEGTKVWQAALKQPSLSSGDTQSGRTCYFLVTAVNAAGESAYSVEAAAAPVPAASKMAAVPVPASGATPALSAAPKGGGGVPGAGKTAPAAPTGAGGAGGPVYGGPLGTPGGPIAPLPAPGSPLPPGGPDLPQPPQGSDSAFYLTLNASVLSLFAPGSANSFTPEPVTSTVTIVSQSGLLGPVQCSVIGLPPGVTAMFYPQQPELTMEVDGHSVTSVTLYLFGGGAFRGKGGGSHPASVQASLVDSGRTASAPLFVDAPH